METQNQVKGNDATNEKVQNINNNFSSKPVVNAQKSDNVWLSDKPKIVNKLAGKPPIDDNKQPVTVIVNSEPKVVNISAIPSQIGENQSSLKTLQKFISYLKASDMKTTANLPTEISPENINKNVSSKPVINVQKSTKVRLTAKQKITHNLTGEPPIRDKKQPVNVIVNSEPKVVDNISAIPSQISENESSLKTLEKLILYFKATDKKKTANLPIVISPDRDDNKELNRRKRSFVRNPIRTTKNGSSAKIHDLNFDHCYCKRKEGNVPEILTDRGMLMSENQSISSPSPTTRTPAIIKSPQINQSDTELGDDLFCFSGPSELEIIESPWRRIQYQFSKRYKQAIESASFNIDHLLIKFAEPVIKTENLN